jgi:hypothetical protein
MKRVLFYAMLFLSTMVVYTACCKDDETTGQSSCVTNTTTRNKSVNVFDLRSGSPYYNQVVANFRFTQLSNTYSGSPSCPLMNCGTSLSIQNNTNKKITFDYNINFTLNLAHWNYQGVATINSGASVDIGQISDNCASLDLGGILIQSASITYQ